MRSKLFDLSSIPYNPSSLVLDSIHFLMKEVLRLASRAYSTYAGHEDRFISINFFHFYYFLLYIIRIELPIYMKPWEL